MNKFKLTKMFHPRRKYLLEISPVLFLWQSNLFVVTVAGVHKQAAAWHKWNTSHCDVGTVAQWLDQWSLFLIWRVFRLICAAMTLTLDHREKFYSWVNKLHSHKAAMVADDVKRMSKLSRALSRRDRWRIGFWLRFMSHAILLPI